MKFFKSRKLPNKEELESGYNDDAACELDNDNLKDFGTENDEREQIALIDNDFQHTSTTNEEVVLVNEPIIPDEVYYSNKKASLTSGNDSGDSSENKEYAEENIADSTENAEISFSENNAIADSGENNSLRKDFENNSEYAREINGYSAEEGNISDNEINCDAKSKAEYGVDCAKSEDENVKAADGDNIEDETAESDENDLRVTDNENPEDGTAESVENNEDRAQSEENADEQSAVNDVENDSGDKENSEENADKDKSDDDKKKKDGKKFGKKTRNILIAIACVIVVLAVSITTPILVLNKGKIFVGSAEDLLKTKGDVYVLKEDVTYTGDLTLSKNINLKGNHLRVNGVLTLDLTESQISIGTLKKKVYTSEGNISASKLVIKGAGALTAANVITVEEMEITAKKVKFNSNITVQNKLTINADNAADEPILFAGRVNFGTNPQGVTLKKSKVKFDQGVMADINAIESKVNVGVTVGNITLDDKSELRCYAKVLKDFDTQEYGSVTGGAMVYMSEESGADMIDGAKVYWTSQSNNNIREERNIGVRKYIMTLQTPSYGNILVEGEKIFLKLDVAQSAERYSIKVDQDEEIIIKLTESEKQTHILKTDIVSEKLSKVGKHIITVVAMGAEGESEFVKNSAPLQLEYEHDMQLKTPENIKVEKKGSDYLLTFDGVIFADYYEVVFDTVKLGQIPKDEGLIEGGKLVINLSKKDVLNDKFTVGKHVVTVVAKSNNPNIKPSVSDFTTFKITEKHAAVTLSVDNDAATLKWNSAPNALTYTIYIDRGQGFVQLAVVKGASYQLTESGVYAVVVDGIANGYYEASDKSNAVTFIN